VKTYTHPDLLPATATASEVIKAWAARLKDVRDSCAPQDADEFHDAGNFYLNKNSRNVKLLKTTVHPHDVLNSSGQHRSTQQQQGDSQRRHAPPPPSVTDNNTMANSSPSGTSRKQHYQQQQQQQSVVSQSSQQSVSGIGRNPPRSSPSHQSSTAPQYAQNSNFEASNKPNKSYMDRSKQLSSGRNIDWAQELQRFYTSINMPEKIPSECRSHLCIHSCSNTLHLFTSLSHPHSDGDVGGSRGGHDRDDG
jgi:hypothetical protein